MPTTLDSTRSPGDDRPDTSGNTDFDESLAIPATVMMPEKPRAADEATWFHA